jgi:hypothetical protein
MTEKPQFDAIEGMLDAEVDAVWGAAAIGKEIGLSAPQVLYLFRKTDLLNSAVKKVAHRTLVGSRKRLRDVAIPTA